MPQGKTIGGDAGEIFLADWRQKAVDTYYRAASRNPAIACALKQEYINFYDSINIDRSPSHAKNAFGSANPDKKGKQSVRPSLTP